MANKTTISHPVINAYITDFIDKHEITGSKARDKHAIFEQYINDLILSIYSNDPSVTYEDMDTGTAFGIDGVAIFVSDRLVTSINDVDLIIEGIKKFEVSFYFTQSKTSNKFDRKEISDFFTGVKRFFDFTKCQILELKPFWEVAKYIYSKSSKLKKQPSLHMKFACLSPSEINLDDHHMKAEIDLGLQELNVMALFNEVKSPEFLGIKDIMSLHEKNTSGLEVSIRLSKQPVPYPKDNGKKIKNGYYGLIRLSEFINLLTDEVNGEFILRKGIFNDNIRYYLGSSEKIEVNSSMKEQLIGTKSYLFGLLNNGITIIADDIFLNAEDLTLTNYQIVNGCQTSNVIFECLEHIQKSDDIFIPIRLISTEDEDTKHAIIKATNSQTQLKPEQLVALSSIQKAIEEYYNTKNRTNSCPLYYERRTEQYRDENITKARIINIPFQIKATSALFFDLPHEVSGQYGKVVKQTGDLLFEDSHLSFLNSYYVSGLAWYKVERFVQNDEVGRNYRRARWHIIMILKYLCCPDNKIKNLINKESEEISVIMEKVLLDEKQTNDILKKAIEIIGLSLSQKQNIEDVLADRKTFERKDTTTIIINYIKENEIQL